ncbi:MAG TPA: phosphatidate cytidylyltransferase [Acidimicrobiia bacterium]|nr:phosphatidate cytidylyltransferase [Acidimicrobiia bacterium]
MPDLGSPRLPGMEPETPTEGTRFTRPWEQPLDESPEEEESEEEVSEQPTDGVDDLMDYDDEASTISEEVYLSATTAEYRDLAEEVARAEYEEPFSRPAVAASIAGVGSGLVDFEDVTGLKGVSEEEIEHVEQAAASDLTLRVISALVLVGLFMATLFLGGWWFTAFIALVMVVALGEFYATLRRHGFVPLAVFGLAGVVGSAIAAHVGGPGPVLVTMVLSAVLVVLFFSVVSRRRPLDNAAVTVLGAVWVAQLSFAVIIGRSEQAASLILLLVLIAALFDIGGYFVGKAFGRQPIAPVLSPRKTWEGFVGGVVAAAGSAAVLSTVDWFPVTTAQALVLSILVVVLAPLGDGAESMIKRSLGVKDMGTVLPGHGGMLDRVDALLFVVPAAYVFFLSANLL